MRSHSIMRYDSSNFRTKYYKNNKGGACRVSENGNTTWLPSRKMTN